MARRFEENETKFDEMIKMMWEMSVNCLAEVLRDDATRLTVKTIRTVTNWGNFFPRPYTPKIEFLKFDGSGAITRVKQCVK